MMWARCGARSVANRAIRGLRPAPFASANANASVSTATANANANEGALTKQQAVELALRLTDEERRLLIDSLQEFESKRIKDEYEGQLAAHKWRSKFGRPSKVPKLGDVDPTGTYCPVPDDWLKKKYAATVPRPKNSDLFHLLIANSIPFIGFGFLDNFIMIVAGDYIDHMLGAYICLSTMAAAALGNTFSDVIGIGSAFYVERFAERVGFQPPKLTPIQLDMPVSRRASNMGRVFGITLGCLLGMFPLLFLKDEAKPTPNPKLQDESKTTAPTPTPTTSTLTTPSPTPITPTLT